jgi:hypothetical protein
MDTQNEGAEVVEEIQDLPVVADGEEDTTDYKAEALKYQGIAKRYKTKLEKSKEVKPISKTEPVIEKPGELDYAKKAFLTANGVKGSDEIKLAEEYLATGKYTLEQVIENKHFNNDLKDMRDDKAAKAAMPTGGRGAGGSAKDSVEYYLSKNEMPPEGKTELRRQYVNERYKREKSVSHFSNRKV